MLGGCGTRVKFDGPSFFEISNRYFADEAPRSFAVEAGVFAALILTAVLPIVNSVQAVATLIHQRRRALSAPTRSSCKEASK